MENPAKTATWTSNSLGNFQFAALCNGNEVNAILNSIISSPSPWKKILGVMTAAIPIGIIS